MAKVTGNEIRLKDERGDWRKEKNSRVLDLSTKYFPVNSYFDTYFRPYEGDNKKKKQNKK